MRLDGNLICRVSIIASALLLDGCAPARYAIPRGKPQATILFDVGTESIKPWTPTIGAIALTNANDCKAPAAGGLFGSVHLKNGLGTIGPVTVAANERLTFMVAYQEGFPGGLGECNFVTAFVPKEGHSYVARFRSLGNLSSCNVHVQDRSEPEMPQVPTYDALLSCGSFLTHGKQVANGTPTIYRLHVIVSPY